MITALHEGFGLAPNLMTTIDCALLGDGESDRAYLVTVLNEAQVIDVMDETRGGGATLMLDNLDDLPMYGQARLRNLMSAIETKGPVIDGILPDSALRIVATVQKPLREAVE